MFRPCPINGAYNVEGIGTFVRGCSNDETQVKLGCRSICLPVVLSHDSVVLLGALDGRGGGSYVACRF